MEKSIPLGSSKPEAVGKLPLQRIPELLLLLLGKTKEAIVVALESLVRFGDFGIGLVRAMTTAAAVSAFTAAATATTASSSTTSL